MKLTNETRMKGVLLETDRRMTDSLESGMLKVETRDQQQFLEGKTEEKNNSCSETGNRRRGSSEQEEKGPLLLLNPALFL